MVLAGRIRVACAGRTNAHVHQGSEGGRERDRGAGAEGGGAGGGEVGEGGGEGGGLVAVIGLAHVAGVGRLLESEDLVGELGEVVLREEQEQEQEVVLRGSPHATARGQEQWWRAYFESFTVMTALSSLLTLYIITML
jgi:hypothetical protein